MCRLPQLWFWLPTQSLTVTTLPLTRNRPRYTASGNPTRLLAFGKLPRYIRSGNRSSGCSVPE